MGNICSSWEQELSKSQDKKKHSRKNRQRAFSGYNTSSIDHPNYNSTDASLEDSGSWQLSDSPPTFDPRQ